MENWHSFAWILLGYQALVLYLSGKHLKALARTFVMLLLALAGVGQIIYFYSSPDPLWYCNTGGLLSIAGAVAYAVLLFFQFFELRQNVSSLRGLSGSIGDNVRFATAVFCAAFPVCALFFGTGDQSKSLFVLLPAAGLLVTGLFILIKSLSNGSGARGVVGWIYYTLFSLAILTAQYYIATYDSWWVYALSFLAISFACAEAGDLHVSTSSRSSSKPGEKCMFRNMKYGYNFEAVRTSAGLYKENNHSYWKLWGGNQYVNCDEHGSITYPKAYAVPVSEVF